MKLFYFRLLRFIKKLNTDNRTKPIKSNLPISKDKPATPFAPKINAIIPSAKKPIDALIINLLILFYGDVPYRFLIFQ